MYIVEVLSESIINDKYIPINLYCEDTMMIDEEKISLINKIYRPDLLIIECEDWRIKNNDMLDVVITNTKKEILMVAKENNYNFYNMDDVVITLEELYK